MVYTGGAFLEVGDNVGNIFLGSSYIVSISDLESGVSPGSF